MKVAAAAPGKVILTGEHFVVYGEPALVMAIDRYVQVTVSFRPDNQVYVISDLGVSGFFEQERFRPEAGGIAAQRILEPIKISAKVTLETLDVKKGLNIEVTSTLPIAVGLGSSSALAVATVAATGRLLGTTFTKDEIIQLSTEAEKYVHINPSGVDQSIAAYGNILSYCKSQGISRIQTDYAIPLVIGNTGIRRNTGQIVDSVSDRGKKLPNIMQSLTSIAGTLTRAAIEAAKQGQLEQLGLLMDINHGLLSAIGVSNEYLERLVYAAKHGGALGAKLTGAGGGGCIIALAHVDRQETVAHAISQSGGTPILVRQAKKGVRAWVVR
ncbi:MAG: mevalonate kinase [Candidatus Bathyarchaeota archaeon]|nr:MAG: mevalonate kinase [Candidatus Bathyarchaeota archaeon]